MNNQFSPKLKMEMQEQITQNDIVYDEAHDVKNDNEELESEGEDSDNIEEGLPILIHVKRFKGGVSYW